MPGRTVVSLAVVAVVLLAGWAVAAQSQERAPVAKAWEYREVQLSALVEATPALNKMGDQGWELVGVTSACTERCLFWAYFKRPK